MRKFLIALLLSLSVGFSLDFKFEYEEKIEGMDFEDVKLLLKTALDGRNMNVLDVIDVSTEPPRFSIFLVCNLSYAEKILPDMPEFGTIAPCRIYMYEDKDGNVIVGYINIPTLLKIYQKFLTKDAVDIFKVADDDIKEAIKEAKGEF
jgi:uncharacterized protein (DUF302 family)